MTRKLLAVFLASAMMFMLMPNAALTAPGDIHKVNDPGTSIELLGGTPEWVFFKQGRPPQNGIAALWTLEELDSATKLAYFEQIIAIDSSVSNLNIEDVEYFYGNQIITNSNGNTGQYQVVKVGSKWYAQVLSGSVSHITYKEGEDEDPMGELEVSLDMKAQDYHNVYKQDYHNVYKQDYHNVYKQDFHNVMK